MQGYTIKSIKSQLYKEEIDSEDAVEMLNSYISAEDLARFIVDAFDRGWVSNFNMGLDDDGNPM